ncbi:hypoxanthine phosphoribosyltransferase [Clostridium sp. MSJ-8]|uniref:hypoxanthine phosphoribosyltransferase n=1 Tax=Clostridium sp. MSJ-8 TaxID=2841510 RepID=UPI001C0F1A20|nr:hypoxanthine phosphoribosyltransferase [Clostridium sp. MSJ-8]MBU5486709.1 hypoxanthine phosphoribosyltransferase [Clostridium sp. MSJ-8]
MKNDIERVLYSEEAIGEKVKEIGEKISKDYAGKDLLVVVILKGSAIFAADLVRNISIHCNIDFMSVSSYGNGTESSGEVQILKDITNIEGRNVLIVEDIVDSGITLSHLVQILNKRNPNSIEIATLLNKPSRRVEQVDVKYYGYEVPNEFLVGYGLDYDEKYRNLPYIGILKREVYEK